MISHVILMVVSFLFFANQSDATCTGCLSLDALTFDKVLSKFKTVLIKFDIAFPYGRDHESFSSFASEIQNASVTSVLTEDLIVASVGIKDYGDKENAELGKRYGITGEVFPVIMLFNDGSTKNPVSFATYTKEISVLNLYKFMKKYGKVYVPLPGCDRELDKLAQRFMLEQTKRTEVKKSAEDYISKIACDKKREQLNIYIILMDRINEKGSEILAAEKIRVEKLLKGKIIETKKQVLSQRLNILTSFEVNEAKDEL